jgi:hypothetical protein
VEGGAPLLNTESAAVSTLIENRFVENMPLNGRSFSSLIELTPGVVLTQSTFYDQGQFAVNGQRPDSNYFTVDGVSANLGPAIPTSARAELASFRPPAPGAARAIWCHWMLCRNSGSRLPALRRNLGAPQAQRCQLSRSPARISLTEGRLSISVLTNLTQTTVRQ